MTATTTPFRKPLLIDKRGDVCRMGTKAIWLGVWLPRFVGGFWNFIIRKKLTMTKIKRLLRFVTGVHLLTLGCACPWLFQLLYKNGPDWLVTTRYGDDPTGLWFTAFLTTVALVLGGIILLTNSSDA